MGKIMLLESLLKRNMSYSELKEALDVSDPVLQRHLKDLRFEGLIEKKGRRYVLTGRGEAFISGLLGGGGRVERSVAKMVVFNGCLQHLHTPRSILKNVLLSPYLVIRTFLALGKEDKAYRDFLVGLYINSVVKLLDKGREELSFQEVRCAWQLTRDVEDRREGLTFSFDEAWRNCIDKSIKETLDEKYLTKERIFRFLKIISYPISERSAVMKQLDERKKL